VIVDSGVLHIYYNCVEYNHSDERTTEYEPQGESSRHQHHCYKKGCHGKHGGNDWTDEEVQYPPVVSDLLKVVHNVRPVPRWRGVPVEIRQASPQEGDLFIIDAKLSQQDVSLLELAGVSLKLEESQVPRLLNVSVADDGPDVETIFDEEARPAIGAQLSDLERELPRCAGIWNLLVHGQALIDLLLCALPWPMSPGIYMDGRTVPESY
jgi:hypothetical protein